MFRSPSEPSPFSSVRCPYDSHARCGRPYCPFAHRTSANEDVGLVEGATTESTNDDVLLLDSDDHLSADDGHSLGAEDTDIRQENPTDQFSGCYVGYVSTTKVHHNAPLFPPSAAPSVMNVFPQPPAPQQQQNQQHIFFPNLPSTHQPTTFALPQQFQPPNAMPPQYAQSSPFVTPPYPYVQQQYSASTDQITYIQPTPLATVSTMAPQFSPVVHQPLVPPSSSKQHRHHNKRPKPGPGGLPAYIPTPIAQLEKEQREREQRMEERRVRKEQKETEHGPEKQSDGIEKTAQKTDEHDTRGGGRRGSVAEEESADRETKERKADYDTGGGLNIDRIMNDQKQLLDEMADNRERKIREILRVEAEHVRRVHLAKQKTASKKFVSSNKTTAAGSLTKVSSKLSKARRTIDKKKTAATPKKKKLLVKNGTGSEKKERRTVIKALIEDKRRRQQQKEEAERKEAAEEEERKKRQKQAAVNDCVKHVAELDKEIAKIQSEIRRSNNKMAFLNTRKLATSTAKTSTANSTGNGNVQKSADTTDEEKQKKIPIWRKGSDKASKPSSFLEDPRFYLATQHHHLPAEFRPDGTKTKSLDSMVKDLFGDDIEEANDMSTADVVEKKRKKPNAGPPPPTNGKQKALKPPPLSTTKQQKGRPIQQQRRTGETDFDDVQRERQAMIDSIMEEENFEHEEEEKANRKKASSPPPQNSQSASKKRKFSRSPSVVTLSSSSPSSDSVVPETPPASPRAKTSSADGAVAGGEPPLMQTMAPKQQQQRRVPPSAEEQLRIRTVAAVLSASAAASANNGNGHLKMATDENDDREQHNYHSRHHLEHAHVKIGKKTAIKTAAAEKGLGEEYDAKAKKGWPTKAQAEKEKDKKLSSNSSKLNNAHPPPSTPTELPSSANNYVPSRVPMHHPSQRPTAPKPFPSSAVAKSSATGGAKVSASLASATTFVSSNSAAPHQQKQQHNDNINAKTKPATVPKGTVRKAHVPKFQAPSTSAAASKLLVPLEPLNRKVPLQLRQRHLSTIYAEYAKICADDPSRAIEGAQNEEKSVLDRCNGKMGYLAAIPMLIKRLREAAANEQSHEEGEARRRDSVSHISVLLGRHAKTVTCGLHRADRSSVAAQHTNFSEIDFYNALQEGFLLTDQQLWDNGYPRWAEESPADDDGVVTTDSDIIEGKRLVTIRQSELDAGKSRIPFVDDSVLSRVCDRCGKEYRLTKEGDYAPGASSDQCIFHWGRAWKKRVSGTVESRYNCCDQPLTVQGCDVAPHHITQTQRLSTLRSYTETPRPFGVGDPRSKKVYALDCEMVYTVWGPEVARLSVVDITGDLILDLIIRPEHRIVDCNTKFSGLKPEQVMAGDCDLNEAQQRFFELVNAATILLGHSLESDLRALHLVHRRVVDTSVVFPHRMGPPYKRALKTLAAEITQMIIQDDESGHDSKEDALACMRIMLRKCRGGGVSAP